MSTSNIRELIRLIRLYQKIKCNILFGFSKSISDKAQLALKRVSSEIRLQIDAAGVTQEQCEAIEIRRYDRADKLREIADFDVANIFVLNGIANNIAGFGLALSDSAMLSIIEANKILSNTPAQAVDDFVKIISK